MRKNILSKKIGFSILELLLVLAITGVLIICMTPALTRKPTPPDVTQKVTCIPGKRIVVQNLFVPQSIGTAPAREGIIELPPGLTSFVLTMAAGGAGGGIAYVDEKSHKRNIGGHGGGGGESVYKLNVEFTLLNPAIPAKVEYRIGGGGSGGEPQKSTGYSYDYADPRVNQIGILSYPSNGGSSTLTISNIKIDAKNNIGCPEGFSQLNATSCKIDLAGGTGRAEPKHSGTGYLLKNFAEYDSASRTYLKFFKSENDDIKTYDNYYTKASGGWTTKLSKTKANKYPRLAGQDGERSVEILPGLGGGSVFGVGSFGSGGNGGMNAAEKRFNIKRGTANYTRFGEDGAGGILILDYDSVCTNRKN